MVPRIARARREVQESLKTLQTGESFNIVAFCGYAQPFEAGLVAPDARTVARANNFLDNQKLDEGTNLELGLSTALATRGVNLVVVITDGVPTTGQTKWKKLTRLIRELNHNRARIFTIGLVGRDPQGKDRTFQAARLLNQIASENNGAYREVPLG